MSAADIQAFLDKQTGPLKSLVTPDYEQGHHAEHHRQQHLDDP